MVVYNNATNNYSTARFMVSANPGQGNYRTIAAAVAAASSGDVIFLMPGTYNEDITLKGGVNFTCFTSSGEYGAYNVIINGKFIDNGVGVNSSFTDIQLNAEGDYCLELTGTGSSIQFIDCNIQAVDHAAISMSQGDQNIYLYSCIGNILSTGIGLWNIPAGDLWVYNCQFDNYGASTTPGTFSGGGIQMYNTVLGFPIAASGTAQGLMNNCSVDCFTLNTSCITTSGSALMDARYCYLQSGSASPITIGSGSTVKSNYNTFNSSNQYMVSS